MLPDNNILDLIISLVLIYALLSIMVSVLTEWVNKQQKSRAMFLRKSIFLLLRDPLNVDFGELVYNHYLVNGLRNKELKTKPQYISSRLFAEVLIDVIASRKQLDVPIQRAGEMDSGAKKYVLIDTDTTHEKSIVQKFNDGLDLLHPSPLVDTLKSFRDKSKNFDELKSLISFWYDDYMDRVSGWFKQEQRWKLRTLGMVVAIALNVDSLHLVKIISLDDKLRNSLVSTAEHVADQYQTIADTARGNSTALLKTFSSVTTKPDSLLTKAAHLAHINDSIATAMMMRADSVLGIAAGLNVPIGWDRAAAPLTWFGSKQKEAPPGGKGILAYIERRNDFTWGNLFYYLFGVFISGLALSLGAPFWFEALVKLINIRRAGKKPETVNETKK